jgi:glycosyltransferase involved in cell wall biosynthesis
VGDIQPGAAPAGALRLYLPGPWFWAMERRARAELARWAAPRLEGIALVDALSTWGTELGPLVQRSGGRHVCNRGSSHILFQRDLLTEEFARWSCPPPDGFPDWLVERELAEYASADAIAVPSTFVRRTFEARGVPAARVHVTPYGVDLRRFRPHPREDDRFRVLFVGSASVRKGSAICSTRCAPSCSGAAPSSGWWGPSPPRRGRSWRATRTSSR